MRAKQVGAFSPVPLVGAVLVAVASSICCVGPFLLLATGLSGAWMSRMMVLEPYQPILAAVSLSFVLYAGLQLFFQKASCISVDAVGLRSRVGFQLAVFVGVLAVVLALLSSEHWIVVLAG